MREIILDTETTGLDPSAGDRIVEIGAVEIVNGVPTGAVFHKYINPEREVPLEAFNVHGLSTEFLRRHEVFNEILDEFNAFIGSDRLVIHNAEFDMKFLNAELSRLGAPTLSFDRVVDTLALARKKHPGTSNSLDALCARYGIDASRRKKHGALLDAELLAEVYQELCGGRQSSLVLQTTARRATRSDRALMTSRPAPLAARLTNDEIAAHEEQLGTFGSPAIWAKYS